MDTIAHCLMGCVLGAGVAATISHKAANDRQTILKCSFWMVAGSNLPDIDAVLSLVPDGFIYRRTMTHSLLFLPFLAGGLGWIAHKLISGLELKKAMLWSLGALLLHNGMDLLNSFGVALFWPLTSRRFELASVFVVDLVFWIVPVLGLLSSWALKKWYPRAPYRVCCTVVTLLILYSWACSSLREIAMNQLRSITPLDHRIVVYHEPFGPLLWRGVVQDPAGNYRVYKIAPLAKTVLPGIRLVPAMWDPDAARVEQPSVQLAYVMTNDAKTSLVQTLRNQHANVKSLEKFFRSPVWRTIGPNEAELMDLRFASLRLSGRRPFVYRFRFKDEASL